MPTMIKLNLCKSILTRSLSTAAYHVPKMSRNKEPILKTRANAAELFRKRAEQVNNKKNLILNQADLQFIGSDCQGFRPSLLVTTEGNSYLFNCGEGTQRFCYSNRVKLVNLRNLFITNHSWDCVAGTFGLSLTVQDIGQTSFTIHSTEKVTDLFKSTQGFMAFTSGIKCSTRTHLDGDFKDDCIEIKPIPIDGVNIEENGDHTAVNKKFKTDTRLLAYVCSLPDLPGPLDPIKCRNMKVPVGPMLGVLKSGKDVTLNDGTIVKSADVCGPPNRGLRFVVVDSPTENDIHPLINNPKLNEYKLRRRANDQDEIGMVVHFSPENVVNNPDYQEWMSGFPDGCKHLLAMNSDYKRANFIDSYRLQYLLRSLDAEMFPPLYLPESLSEEVENELNRSADASATFEYALTNADETEPRVVLRGDINELDKIVKVRSLDKFVVRPNNVLESIEPRMLVDILHRAAKLDPDWDQTYEEYTRSLAKIPPPKDYEPEVVFLGTGSALPSKIRNTSGILVNLQKPNEASIIMDCGEDTYGQLLRFYGPERTRRVLKRLKMIYVSHQHADHHLGLISLIRNRRKVCDDPLILLLPSGLDNLIEHHDENYEDLSGYYQIYNTRSLKSKPTDPNFQNDSLPVLKQELCRKLDGILNDFKLVGVDHCANACAVVFDFNTGNGNMKSFKIAYSGDARPSEDFVLAAKSCDLLIHEATFDHLDQEEALTKKHCTSSEAILVAKRMRAKFTILTHFSQKLPKIPYFTEEFDDKIGFAFDNMAIRCPSHFERIPIMKEILSVIFSKSLGEIKAKHDKQDAKKIMVEKLIEQQRTNSLSQAS